MTDQYIAPGEEERAKYQAAYAVAMHLHGNRKTGIFCRFALIAGAVAAAFLNSLWPLVIAVLAAILAWFIIMKSCARFVERQIGMPPAMQIFFSAQYKKDIEFAKKVDALFAGMKPSDG